MAVPVFLFVRMALNAIDGMLAREHGRQFVGEPLRAGDVEGDFLAALRGEGVFAPWE